MLRQKTQHKTKVNPRQVKKNKPQRKSTKKIHTKVQNGSLNVSKAMTSDMTTSARSNTSQNLHNKTKRSKSIFTQQTQPITTSSIFNNNISHISGVIDTAQHLKRHNPTKIAFTAYQKQHFTTTTTNNNESEMVENITQTSPQDTTTTNDTPMLDENGQPLSKSAMKKLLKQQQQAEFKAKKAAENAQQQTKSNQGSKKPKVNDASASLALGVKKDEDFAKWYQQLMIKSELIDYYDISGCYILRPWAYEIWEHVQKFLDTEFKKLGVKNAYFPMFVPKKNLEKEKDHIEGFSAEVAWVTHSGSTPLDEPIAVRPTSETIMYPAYAKWIQSHRDLPLRLNQWCNVVRWEFKDPTPFLRSREFLWQEGHTAHATYESAAKEVIQILDIYARAYEEVLACSVIKGKKTELEKFAGGQYTTTIEGFIPGSGRGIQAATSHCLGQNFSKMFDITFQTDTANSEREYVWQNSWGFTTRSLGVMFMTHSDDKGLVLPPKVAPIQVVFVPIYKGDNIADVDAYVEKLAENLKKKDVRVEVDNRQHVRPGFKYNHWELKGVPLRVEIGERDIEQGSGVVVRRDKLGDKNVVDLSNFEDSITTLLDTMQAEMAAKAKSEHMGAVKTVTKWDDFITALQSDQLGLIPWCGDSNCEEDIKKQSAEDSKHLKGKVGNSDKSGAAKSLCIPFEQPEEPIEDKCCIKCEKPAEKWTLFGRSY